MNITRAKTPATTARAAEVDDVSLSSSAGRSVAATSKRGTGGARSADDGPDGNERGEATRGKENAINDDHESTGDGKRDRNDDHGKRGKRGAAVGRGRDGRGPPTRRGQEGRDAMADLSASLAHVRLGGGVLSPSIRDAQGRVTGEGR